MSYVNCNISDYILQQTGLKPSKKGNKILINPCPVCGHRDHFYIYTDTDSYFSFSGCCKGGSIVDWLVEYEGLTLAEAMQRVHGDKPKEPIQQNKKLAELLAEKVESFFDACINQYKIWSDLEADFKAMDIDFTDPLYRYIRQATRFYDRITDKFINGDFDKRVQLMRAFKNEYFHKLKVGDMT